MTDVIVTIAIVLGVASILLEHIVYRHGRRELNRILDEVTTKNDEFFRVIAQFEADSRVTQMRALGFNLSVAAALCQAWRIADHGWSGVGSVNAWEPGCERDAP